MWPVFPGGQCQQGRGPATGHGELGPTTRGPWRLPCGLQGITAPRSDDGMTVALLARTTALLMVGWLLFLRRLDAQKNSKAGTQILVQP